MGVLLALASPGRAQSGDSFDHDLFDPLPSPSRNLLGVATSDVLPHLALEAGLLAHYADDAITVVDAADRGAVVRRAIDSALTLDVSLALGLFDRFSLGVALPLTLTQSGSDLTLFGRPGESVSGFALGDLRVVPTGVVLAPADTGGLGVALAVPVYIPTGDADSFRTDEAVRVAPTLVVDFATDAFRLAANVGYMIRPERTAANYVSDDQLRWGVGARVTPVPALSVVATLFGSWVTKDSRDPLDPTKPIGDGVGTSVEVLGGLEAHLGALTLAGGAGTAIVHAVGTPDVRAYLTVSAATGSLASTGPDDRDQDGLDDDIDKCPEVAEDRDGFEDGDGCPDPDNDGDGVADTVDRCPEEAEDLDDFEDEDGCPDPDNDGDGIPDAVDKCPDDPEDKDGLEDDDGCPEVDADGDGVPDTADKCPAEAEDKDGIQDDDGCPETDGDGDGVPDEKDKCPDRGEVVNGYRDDDGCPDAKYADVDLTDKAIVPKKHVYFVTDSVAINKIAAPVLDEIAQILLANPWITKLRIEGHTDSEGTDEYNRDLSQRRTESIVDYFVEKGVARERLEAIGYGESRPVATNTTPYGRSKNRRIEFNFVEINGKPVPGVEPLPPSGGAAPAPAPASEPPKP
ncbi:MAG: OmpA family protein [Myxococcales bacterium]|nr:OmpA family protein [Myxococcales bacterium]